MKKSCSIYPVIGLGFGDEGKGLVVNSLCQQLQNPLVIRYSGGQQAGHTVTLPNGLKHTFSNFGSGTLQNVPTYWSEYCTFDPVGAIREYSILVEKGFDPKLYINRKCPVTTPYEKEANKHSAAMRHGTCGVGVGATWKREENFHSLLVEDFFHPSVMKIKLALIGEYYGCEYLDENEYFLKCCEMVTRTFEIISCIPGYSNYVFEGSQGLLLDQNTGFFPHVTRSNTGMKNIHEMGSKMYPEGYQWKPFLVTRAFQTRHGNGPMTNEHIPHNIKENPNETNVFNEFQGKFRKSLLDLDLLRYALDKEKLSYSPKNLVVTCLDLVQNEYRYTDRGEIVSCVNEDEFVNNLGDELHAHKVHRVRSPDGIVSLAVA